MALSPSFLRSFFTLEPDRLIRIIVDLISIAFRKAIKRASGSYVYSPIGNGGRGEAFVVEGVHREYFPVAAGLQHGDRAPLPHEEDFAVGGDGRCEVLINRASQPPLL